MAHEVDDLIFMFFAGNFDKTGFFPEIIAFSEKTRLRLDYRPARRPVKVSHGFKSIKNLLESVPVNKATRIHSKITIGAKSDDLQFLRDDLEPKSHQSSIRENSESEIGSKSFDSKSDLIKSPTKIDQSFDSKSLSSKTSKSVETQTFVFVIYKTKKKLLKKPNHWIYSSIYMVGFKLDPVSFWKKNSRIWTGNHFY